LLATIQPNDLTDDQQLLVRYQDYFCIMIHLQIFLERHTY